MLDGRRNFFKLVVRELQRRERGPKERIERKKGKRKGKGKC